MDYRGRIEAVKEQLVEKKQDALVVAGQSDSYYFSGFHTVSDGNYPLVTIPAEGDPVLLVSGLDKDAAAYASQIELVVPDNGFVEAITTLLPDDPAVLIGSRTQTGFYNKLNEHATVTIDDDIVADLRSVKDAEELDHIREAYRVAEDALDSVTENLADATETSTAAELEYTMRMNGSQGAAFPTIVATNASSSMPHHTPGDTAIEEGPLLFDLGATVDGYRSDMSRTLHVGEPSDAFRDAYEVVLDAHETAAEQLRPGVTASEIDETARNVLEDAGYGDAFKHSTGHGLGIDVHEAPNLSHKNDDELKEGMVVTIEPGIYLKGDFGVRIEDGYVITEDGAERLTESSRELTVI